MADHGYFEELICAELDGELTEEQRAELDAHLRECEQCRAFRQAMSAIEGVSARHLSEPPEELTANVMAAIRAEAGRKKKGKVIAFPGRSLAVAAAAALVLWAGVRAVNVLRPKGLAAPAPMMAAAVESDASAPAEAPEEVTEEAPEEAVQAREYAEEEAPDMGEARADASVKAAGGPLFSNAMPTHGAAQESLPREETLCRISDRNGPLRELPFRELPEGLLVPDRPCAGVDREPDYILLVYVTEDDPKEYRFWEQDGVMVVETDTGEVGFTVSAEDFKELVKK